MGSFPPSCLVVCTFQGAVRRVKEVLGGIPRQGPNELWGELYSQSW